MTSWPAWETTFLDQLGAPHTETNYQALTLWAQSEGTTGSNNPLAISGQHPGATSCIAQCGSSSPVMAYDTLDNGVAANVAFLQNNDYGNVIAAFKQGSSLQLIWAAINQSGWCRGCQGGRYPEAIFSALSSPEQAASLADAAVGSVSGGGTKEGIAGGLVHAAEDVTGLSALGRAVSWTDSLGNLLGDLTSSTWWKRIGLGVFGIAVLGGGFIIFFAGTDTGKKATSEAASAGIGGAQMAAAA